MRRLHAGSPVRRPRWGAGREQGQALIEAAITIPLLLLIAVGIFEFGRAYQTWQILTNAAREGARLAVVPGASPAAVEARVQGYMRDGQLSKWQTPVQVAPATLTVNGAPVPASLVTIDYPFDFIVLRPVARLINNSTTLGAPLTIRATALMRNEM